METHNHGGWVITMVTTHLPSTLPLEVWGYRMKLFEARAVSIGLVGLCGE